MRWYGRKRPQWKIAAFVLAAACALGAPPAAHAGTQAEEHLAASVVSGLQRAIGDNPVPRDYAERAGVRAWLAGMSSKLAVRFPDAAARTEFLATVHYEATRAGLEHRVAFAGG